MTGVRDEQRQAGDDMSDEGSDPTPVAPPASPPSLALRALRALNAGGTGPAVDDATVDDATAVSLTKPEPAPEVRTSAQADALTAPPHHPPARPEPEAGQRRYGVIVAAIVLVAAAVFCALSAWSWRRADDNPTTSHAAVRDAVLRGARIDIETVNTSDYHDPAHVLDTWTAVSTGGLATQYRTNRDDAIKVLAQAKVVTKATVVDAAVTTIDYSNSTATVIASVDVVRTPSTGSAARTRNRFQATLARVGSSWLLSGLKIVSVQLS